MGDVLRTCRKFFFAFIFSLLILPSALSDLGDRGLQLVLCPLQGLEGIFRVHLLVVQGLHYIAKGLVFCPGKAFDLLLCFRPAVVDPWLVAFFNHVEFHLLPLFC